MSNLHLYFPSVEDSSGRGAQWFLGYNEKIRKRLYGDFLQYVAERYKAVLSKHIKTQLFAEKFSPLSPEWVAYKKRMGWDLGFWIATGELEKAIQVEWEANRERWVVGVSKSAKHSRSGVKLEFIVRCLEYGTDRIPARPLFTPTLREVQGNLPRYYRQWKARMRRRGIEPLLKRAR